MRLLGVDFGGVKIGLAVMELTAGIPTPRPYLSASGTLAKDAAAIHQLAKKEEADAVVVGLPTVNGEETKMSRICSRLGALIEKTRCQVFYADEELTSQAAERDLTELGLKASQIKKQVDGDAAAKILLRFKESHEEVS
jgi:putative Holliday junction resolvase